MTRQAALNEYLEHHQDRFIEQLRQLLAIPSISALPEYSDDGRRGADWLCQHLMDIGFPHSEIINTDGHPLVFAEYRVDEQKSDGGNNTQPTLLIYGHYDVQPVDPVDEWTSPPFEPNLRDGNIYCRGACDDKGQIMLVLAALAAWINVAGAPPVNIKILLEGEEEAGGISIEKYVQENPGPLQADAVLICDTHMISVEQPSIITGLRGILYTEIAVSGPKTDLHSGSYGGVAPNPIHALCVLISRLKGEDGVIHIPELKDVIPDITAQERTFWQEDPLKIGEALCEEMGVEHLVGETDYPPLERLGVRPTLEVHGIRGGFIDDGGKTVIPAEAMAKLSMRLPANLNPHEVFGWLEKAVHRNLPAGHKVKLTNLHGGKGLYVDPENPFIKAATDALKECYGTPPVYMREGGSILIAALFDSVLKVPVVLMGFGLPDDNLHAPNEKFSLTQFKKGMKTVADFIGRPGSEFNLCQNQPTKNHSCKQIE